MNPPQEIFRAYDIRGLVDSQLTDELAYHLGRAFGTYLAHHKAKTCSVGYDARATGPSYTRELSQGLRDSGIDVTMIGLVSTPISYYTVWTGMVDAGVMITASHNPSQYNGYKITHNKAKLSSTAYQELYELIREGEFTEGNGTYREEDVNDAYMRSCLETLESGRALRIVVDTGNGTGGVVLPSMLRELGHDVIELYTEPDGNFPNHHPDPSEHETLKDLQQSIADHNADLGLALDGDADRMAIVDEKGGLYHTDVVIAMIVRELLSHEHGAIVYDVKCSKLVKDTIEKSGGTPIESKTGHTFITPLVADHDALLGGEMSGHLFFNDRYYGYDDGIYAACRIAELASKSDKPMSALLPENPYESTPEVKVPVSEDTKFSIVDALLENAPDNAITIDGVKTYTDDGWYLIRASNTSAYLVVRCEDKTRDGLEARKREAEALLNPVLKAHGEREVSL